MLAIVNGLQLNLLNVIDDFLVQEFFQNVFVIVISGFLTSNKSWVV